MHVAIYETCLEHQSSKPSCIYLIVSIPAAGTVRPIKVFIWKCINDKTLVAYDNNLNLRKLSAPMQKVETAYVKVFWIQYWSGNTPRCAYNSLSKKCSICRKLSQSYTKGVGWVAKLSTRQDDKYLIKVGDIAHGACT